MAETIAQIKNSLKVMTDPADPRLVNWRQDSRAGVQQALQQWDKQQLKLTAKRENFKTRLPLKPNSGPKGCLMLLVLMRSDVGPSQAQW